MKKKKASDKKKRIFRSLKDRCKLYGSLYTADLQRDVDLENFFAHTNHEIPISISDCGGLLKPTSKSDALSCVIPDELKKFEAPLTEAYVIDGPAFVNINKPLQKMKNYGEYCDVQIAAALITRLEEQHVKRVGLVFDVFRELSRKSEKKEKK